MLTPVSAVLQWKSMSDRELAFVGAEREENFISMSGVC